MKYFSMVFWAVLLGMVVGFIGSALTQTSFNPMQTLWVSIAFGLILGIVPSMMKNS